MSKRREVEQEEVGTESEEFQKLVAFLPTIPENEVVTWEQIEAAAGIPCRRGAGYSKLWCAFQRLTREFGISFDAVRNVGYRRCTDEAKVTKIPTFKKIRNASRRGLRRLAGADPMRLPPAIRARRDMQAQVLAMVAGVSRPQQIEASLSLPTPQVLPVADTVNALRNRAR